jgi:hypothetical protein
MRAELALILHPIIFDKGGFKKKLPLRQMFLEIFEEN